MIDEGFHRGPPSDVLFRRVPAPPWNTDCVCLVPGSTHGDVMGQGSGKKNSTQGSVIVVLPPGSTMEFSGYSRTCEAPEEGCPYTRVYAYTYTRIHIHAVYTSRIQHVYVYVYMYTRIHAYVHG